MELHLAEKKDIPEINSLFRAVTEKLDNDGISIWDEIYPSCTFSADIKRKSFYILRRKGEIASAFALCEPQSDEGTIIWENPLAKGVYLYRFAVAPQCLKMGVGSHMLKKAEEAAKERGGEYLRLLVVDYNTPAIAFYEKNGYKRAKGTYMNHLNGRVLKEYGYEIKL